MPFDIATTIQTLLSNALVVGIAAWIGKSWAERRLEAQKAAHAAQLESVKGEQARTIETIKSDLVNLGRDFQAGVDKKMMIFKTHFEIEFQAYRDLWALCDQAHDYAAQTLSYYDMDPIDTESAEDERKDSIRRYDECRRALEAGRRQRPFIAKEIADGAVNLLTIATNVTKTYKDVYRISKFERAGGSFDRKDFIREARDHVAEIGALSTTIADQIAARIGRMYVSDFGAA